MGLILPPKVQREIQKEKWREQRAKYRAQLMVLLDFDDPVCKQWEPELRKLDPLVRLGRAKPLAYMPGYPVRPGFYHFFRDNQSAPPSVQPITGPDDEFVEPDSGLLEKLRGMDLQDPRVRAAHILVQRQQELAEEKARQDRHERMNEEVLERYLAASRAQVSMDRSVPWTQTARARRDK